MTDHWASVLRILGMLMGLAIFAVSPALAADLNPEAAISMRSCEKDRARFCGESPEPSESQGCLIAHDKEISVECKQELERYVQIRKQAMSRGGGALSSFGGLNAMGPPVPLLSYDGKYSPGEDATSLIENRFNISTPVYKDEDETIAVSLAGSNLHLGNTLILDSGRKIPTELYRIETGAQYFCQLPEKRNWGLRASVGYAGDKPFANADDSAYSFSANYGFPGSDKGYWMLTVFLSNNSPIGNYVPIPGFIYLYKTETFTGMFGFPILSMQWTPIFPWSFSFALFGPTLQSEIGYGSIDRLQVFSALAWTRQSYILNERDDAKDRLTLEEKKVTVGLRTSVSKGMQAEIQTGQVFDRALYIGNRLFRKDGGTVSIPSDRYLALGFKMKF